jgi:hypothetical protein
MVSPAPGEVPVGHNEAWARLEALRIGSSLIDALRNDPGLPFGPWSARLTETDGAQFTSAREFSGSQVTLEGDVSQLTAHVQIVQADLDADFEEIAAEPVITPESFEPPITTYKKIEHGAVIEEGLLDHPYTIDDLLCNLADIEAYRGVQLRRRLRRHERASEQVLRILNV